MSDHEQRQRYYARLAYLDAVIPEELRRDPEVHAVAQTLCRRDDFTVEGCLVEMLKLVVKVKNDLMTKYGQLYATTVPSGVRVQIPVPSPQRAGAGG